MDRIEPKSDLWGRWSSHYKSLDLDPCLISKDGMICPAKFRTDRSVLFVLKDTNDFAGGDLSQLLRDGPKFQMWHTVSRWAAGILNDFPSYQTIDNHDRMTEALHQVAAINLKKLAGKSRVSMSVVKGFALQDKELLLEQIRSIDPNIVIACGTFDPLISLLDLPVSNRAHHNEPVRSNVINATVFPMRHPNRANNKVTYERLKDQYKGLGPVQP